MHHWDGLRSVSISIVHSVALVVVPVVIEGIAPESATAVLVLAFAPPALMALAPPRTAYVIVIVLIAVLMRVMMMMMMVIAVAERHGDSSSVWSDVTSRVHVPARGTEACVFVRAVCWVAEGIRAAGIRAQRTREDVLLMYRSVWGSDAKYVCVRVCGMTFARNGDGGTRTRAHMYTHIRT